VDALGIQDFVRHLSAATRRARFFAPIRELAPAALARLTSDRGSVFVAEAVDGCIVALGRSTPQATSPGPVRSRWWWPTPGRAEDSGAC
jgi:hypothetical protein